MMDADTRAYLDALIKPVADGVERVEESVGDIRKDVGVLQRFRAQVFAVLGVFLLAGTSGAAWVAMLR